MRPAFFLLLCLCAGAPAHAQQPEPAVRDINAAFEKIDQEHQAWPHHAAIWENLPEGMSRHLHVWQQEAGERLAKVKITDFDDAGLVQKEIFLRDGTPLFALKRSEFPQSKPKPQTLVRELRSYYADGRLIRLLEKKAMFGSGAKLDTSKAKNTPLPVANVEGGPEGAFARSREDAQEALAVVRRLTAGSDLAAAPPRPAAAGSAFWRVIHGTASPDALHALAWGYLTPVDWDQYRQENGTHSSSSDDNDLVNFIVNVRTGAIIGRTGGRHIGDEERYNHLTITSAWHLNPRLVAQIGSGKWETHLAEVFQIFQNEAESLSPAIDLMEPAKSAVLANLQRTNHESLRKFKPDQFTWTLLDPSFGDAGTGGITISLRVIGQVPKDDDEAASFEAKVTLPITPAREIGQVPKAGPALSVEIVPPQ